MIKLLANENFPKKSTTYLRNKGYDIIAIGEEHSGITDTVVMDLAEREHRIILTFDRDYGELIFKHNRRLKSGVIYLRMDHFGPEDPGKWVEDLLMKEGIELDYRLTLLDEKGIRQRKY